MSDANWRAMPIHRLTDHSVLLKALAIEGVKTAGELHDRLAASVDGLPWRMSVWQAEHLCERLNAAGAGDPAYNPLAVADVPATLFSAVPA